jgi:hypothetical protein
MYLRHREFEKLKTHFLCNDKLQSQLYKIVTSRIIAEKHISFNLFINWKLNYIDDKTKKEKYHLYWLYFIFSVSSAFWYWF